jgi:hypothetical protein
MKNLKFPLPVRNFWKFPRKMSARCPQSFLEEAQWQTR